MANAAENEPLIPGDEIRHNDKGFTCRRLWIVPVVILHFLGMGIIMYAIPEYIRSRVEEELTGEGQTLMPPSGGGKHFNPCSDNTSSPDYHLHTKIQQESAKWFIHIGLSNLIPACITNLVLGSYSDVLGRKVIFGICLTGDTIRCAIATIVVCSKADLVFLLLGTAIDGVTGSYTVFYVVLFSYVSDITNPGKPRTVAIVVFETIIGFTVSISSLVTGYFIKLEGFVYPILTATILSALSSVILLTILPETLPQRHRNENKSCLASLVKSVKFYISCEKRLKTCKYLLLMFCFTFVCIPLLSRGTMETLYQLGRPFCWDPSKIGWFGTVKSISSSLIGVGAVFIFHKRFTDDYICLIGIAFGAASFLVEGLATTNAVLYTVPIIASLSFLAVPMIRSLMSSITPAAEQGALFASIGVVETLCSLLGSLTNNIVYAATLSIMNGFVFLVCAAVCCVALIFLVLYMVISRKHPEPVLMEDLDDSAQRINSG